jgi:hypothetical protein
LLAEKWPAKKTNVSNEWFLKLREDKFLHGMNSKSGAKSIIQDVFNGAHMLHALTAAGIKFLRPNPRFFSPIFDDIN